MVAPISDEKVESKHVSFVKLNDYEQQAFLVIIGQIQAETKRKQTKQNVLRLLVRQEAERRGIASFSGNGK